ncbi:segment polarity protein dishevelled homolog DVL-3-like [Watersipora subatra]|uniref:segment polarity protein dishevelled homolog DVL-3-like n=1 Tax=Watersipora subatra TaxID=2589382 RepID=UPI00355B1682
MSIVGQQYSDGESSIFVGDVIAGGAVSRDGRVQPGDLLLAVNGESLEGMSKREAVEMLRQSVKCNREVTLTIVGSWDDGSVTSCATKVEPIEPWQWLAHSSFAYQSDKGPERRRAEIWPNYKALHSQTSAVSSSLSSSMPSTAARFKTRTGQKAMPLETPTDIIANRLRLFIIERNNCRQTQQATRNTVSMNGAELQMWLYNNIKGFKDLAEVVSYASQLIASNYLVPASAYLSQGSNKATNKQFSRSENYIVNTRPATPGRPMTPGAKSLSSMTKNSWNSQWSSSTSRAFADKTIDRLQLLHNQLSSTGLAVRRY